MQKPPSPTYATPGTSSRPHTKESRADEHRVRILFAAVVSPLILIAIDFVRVLLGQTHRAPARFPCHRRRRLELGIRLRSNLEEGLRLEFRTRPSCCLSSRP